MSLTSKLTLTSKRQNDKTTKRQNVKINVKRQRKRGKDQRLVALLTGEFERIAKLNKNGP
jgi:hypothetical protein